MGKNQNSVVVLRIRVKFWWMIPMGVKYNHTKFEQETQRWRPGTGFASGGPQFQKLQFRAKNSLGDNYPSCMLQVSVPEAKTKAHTQSQTQSQSQREIMHSVCGLYSGVVYGRRMRMRVLLEHSDAACGALGLKSPGTHSKRPNKGKRWVHSTCGLTSPCQRALCGPLTP